jgi:hypothetical protein
MQILDQQFGRVARAEIESLLARTSVGPNDACLVTTVHLTPYFTCLGICISLGKASSTPNNFLERLLAHLGFLVRPSHLRGFKEPLVLRRIVGRALGFPLTWHDTSISQFCPLKNIAFKATKLLTRRVRAGAR